MSLILDDATARRIVETASRAASWNQKIYGPFPSPHDSQSIAQEVIIEVLNDFCTQRSSDLPDIEEVISPLTIIRLTKRVLRRARERHRVEDKATPEDSCCADEVRAAADARPRRRKRLPPDVPLPEGMASAIPEHEAERTRRRVELAIDLKELLATMDDSTQAILWMSYAEDLSAREIAIQTGLPEKSVYRIRSEALAKLARKLR
jgi:RNA polymerase sigma factor (sigma-70 family)